MNYQDFTYKELRAELTKRQIEGRSKATTKKEAIKLLMESDRLCVEENFTGALPAPKAAPELEPEPETENDGSSQLPNGADMVPSGLHCPDPNTQ